MTRLHGEETQGNRIACEEKERDLRTNRPRLMASSDHLPFTPLRHAIFQRTRHWGTEVGWEKAKLLLRKSDQTKGKE